jgi:arsenate reductase-like glutaredoxin family protein
MGVIATNNREIKFYYSSATSIGKQALAYVKASDKKILEIDIAKTKVTGTQWAELAEYLDLPLHKLIDTQHPDFIAAYGKAPDIEDPHDWLKLLANCPQAFQHPILVNGHTAIHIISPSDVAAFLDTES